MVLFTSLNTALTGLQANMAALQTIGHNIANANTPGFSRQRVDFQSRSSRILSFGQIGTGSQVTQIRRLIDIPLEARLRDSASALGNLDIRNDTFATLESLFNGLSDQDLGNMIDRFFESIEDLASNPDNISARSQVLQQAQTLSETMNFLATRMRESRELLNSEVNRAVDEINRLTSELARLNRQILLAENGGVDLGSANDLRDRRDLLLRELGDFIEVRAIETSTGEVNVLTGSAFLVFGQQAFQLTTDDMVDDGTLVSTPLFANGSATLDINGGKLKGLLDSRDVILKSFLKELDVLANSIIFEFNRVQSTGQGLERFRDLTSLHSVQDSAAILTLEGTLTASVVQNTIVDISLIGFTVDPTGRRIQFFDGPAALESRTITGFDPATGTLILDEPFVDTPQLGDRYQITDLSFAVTNGSFDLVVTNELTGIQESFNINIDLDKSLPDETLDSIAAQITAASPFITATVSTTNQLRIVSTSNEVTFSFARDTSGFLAAMGINRFFDGVDAGTISVNDKLLRSPELLSAAQSNAAGDNSNAFAYSGLRNTSVFGNSSFEELYQNLIGRLGVQTAEIRERFENQALVTQQLQNQRERISGVNIDEEAVKMLQFQRAFQASARFLAVVDSLLETLLNTI